MPWVTASCVGGALAEGVVEAQVGVGLVDGPNEVFVGGAGESASVVEVPRELVKANDRKDDDDVGKEDGEVSQIGERQQQNLDKLLERGNGVDRSERPQCSEGPQSFEGPGLLDFEGQKLQERTQNDHKV